MLKAFCHISSLSLQKNSKFINFSGNMSQRNGIVPSQPILVIILCLKERKVIQLFARVQLKLCIYILLNYALLVLEYCTGSCNQMLHEPQSCLRVRFSASWRKCRVYEIQLPKTIDFIYVCLCF